MAWEGDLYKQILFDFVEVQSPSEQLAFDFMSERAALFAEAERERQRIYLTDPINREKVRARARGHARSKSSQRRREVRSRRCPRCADTRDRCTTCQRVYQADKVKGILAARAAERARHRSGTVAANP